jgi:hypothetical protein
VSITSVSQVQQQRQHKNDFNNIFAFKGIGINVPPHTQQSLNVMLASKKQTVQTSKLAPSALILSNRAKVSGKLPRSNFCGAQGGEHQGINAHRATQFIF